MRDPRRRDCPSPVTRLHALQLGQDLRLAADRDPVEAHERRVADELGDVLGHLGTGELHRGCPALHRRVPQQGAQRVRSGGMNPHSVRCGRYLQPPDSH